MSDEERLLADLASEWNRIEQRTKEVESFRGEAVIASINEMRYAGRRIVDYLVHKNNGDQDNAIENLSVARAYLTNADHDLTDSVIFFVIERLSEVIQAHGESAVIKFCPKYQEVKQKINEAKKIVSESRGERPKRAASYKNLADDYIPDFISLYDDLLKAPELKLEADLIKIEEDVGLVTKITFVASVASIAGFILSCWSIYLSYHPPNLSSQSQMISSPSASSQPTVAKPGAIKPQPRP